MRVIDPTCTLGVLATNPEHSALRKAKFMKKAAASVTDMRLFRLYSDDTPCGALVRCPLMEVNAWNKNAMAFAYWQRSLGREHLPILKYVEEADPDLACMWKVTYREGGVEDVQLVYAETKAEARREFEKLARVTWVVKSIEAHTSSIIAAKKAC